MLKLVKRKPAKINMNRFIVAMNAERVCARPHDLFEQAARVRAIAAKSSRRKKPIRGALMDHLIEELRTRLLHTPVTNRHHAIETMQSPVPSHSDVRVNVQKPRPNGSAIHREVAIASDNRIRTITHRIQAN